MDEHIHNDECLVIDTIDEGDDGDGYKAEEVPVCKITGETWE